MGAAVADEILFGSFRLRVRERTLSGAKGALPLTSRAFDVLLTLIESRAGVVPKDDILRRVWGDIVVEENNLHVQIAAIRRALGAEHHYILTIPGKGYRFVGDLGEPQPADLPVRGMALIGHESELAAVAALLEEVRRRHAQCSTRSAEFAEPRAPQHRSFHRRPSILQEAETFQAALTWVLGPDGDAELGVKLAMATARLRPNLGPWAKGAAG